MNSPYLCKNGIHEVAVTIRRLNGRGRSDTLEYIPTAPRALLDFVMFMVAVVIP